MRERNKWPCISIVLAGVFFHAMAALPTPTQELVFPQIAAGGGWETEITLVAQGSNSSSGVLVLFAPDGSLLPLSVDGAAPAAIVPYSMLNRSSRSFRLTTAGSARTGFAIVSQVLEENVGAGAVSGIVTYRLRSGGQLLNQVGVLPSPAISRAHLPFDNRAGNRTGLAISSFEANAITLQRYNEQGTFQESRTLTFSDLGQQASFVDEHFPTSANQRGFLIVRSTSPIQALALNLNGTLLSTSAVLSGVLERELRITATDVTNWRLHLVQEGHYLTGLAERLTPTALHTTVSGTWIDDLVILNIHGFTQDGQGVNITLMGRATSADLISLSGSVLVSVQGGTVADTGTFSLSTLASAQF